MLGFGPIAGFPLTGLPAAPVTVRPIGALVRMPAYYTRNMPLPYTTLPCTR